MIWYFLAGRATRAKVLGCSDPFPFHTGYQKWGLQGERLGEAGVQIYSSTVLDVSLLWHCVAEFTDDGFSFIGDRHLLSSRIAACSPFGEPVLGSESAHWYIITGGVDSPLTNAVVSHLQRLGFRFAFGDCLFIGGNVFEISERGSNYGRHT